MLIAGRELVPCPQGHLQGLKISGSTTAAYCGACGSSFDLGDPVDLAKLCGGHSRRARMGRGALHFCSTVEEHVAWEKAVIEGASPRLRLRSAWYKEDRAGRGNTGLFAPMEALG